MTAPVIEPARNPGELEAAAEVVRRVTPWTAVSAAEIEHALKAEPAAALLLARFGGEVAGSGFCSPSSVPDCAYAMLRVVPESRRRGAGSALYAAVSEVVGDAGLSALGGQPGSAEHVLTGVRRAWRGRGWRRL